MRSDPTGAALRWKEVSLGDVADDVTVGFVGPMAHRYVDSGIPFLRSQNIAPYRIDLSDVKRIPDDFHAELKKSELTPGTVVIVRTGKPGTAAVVPDDFPKANCADLVLVRPGKGLDPRFLCYFLNSAVAQNHIDAHVVGAVQQHFNVAEAKRLRLLLPSIAEQRSIASILGALDDKIELNRKMSNTLEAMARALFKSWFVDFDPVRAKMDGRRPEGMDAETAALFPDSLDDSAVGRVPRGWRVSEVGELAEIDKGLSYKGEGLQDSGPALINLGCFVPGGGFDASRLKHYVGEYRERHRVQSGELVVANTDMTQKRLFLGLPAIVPDLPNETHLLYSHHVYALRRRADVGLAWVPFLFHTMLRQEFRDRAAGYATGTTVLALPRDALLALPFARPSNLVVEAFARIAKSIRSLTLRLDQESGLLAAVRDALLPKLMSGELRVPAEG